MMDGATCVIHMLTECVMLSRAINTIKSLLCYPSCRQGRKGRHFAYDK